MLRFEDTEIEFVGARKESYQSDMKSIVENGTLQDDQDRRDLQSTRSLFLNVKNYGLLDPFEGLLDLEKDSKHLWEERWVCLEMWNYCEADKKKESRSSLGAHRRRVE
jgi:hypothetical protein